MVLSINRLSEPVGSMKSWLRADATVPLPDGWLICDGSTVSDATSPFDAKALPDMRGRFPCGHADISNGNFSSPTGDDYFAGSGGTIPAANSVTMVRSHDALSTSGGTATTENRPLHREFLLIIKIK